jgi:hypothetical protein
MLKTKDKSHKIKVKYYPAPSTMHPAPAPSTQYLLAAIALAEAASTQHPAPSNIE